MSSSRLGLRFLHASRRPQTSTSSSRTSQQFSRFSKRWQTTDSTTAAGPAQSTWQKFYNSPVGPKTVHFWAPVMKWGLVLAGVADFARPAEKLSLTQNAALTATGAIWTRWCLIIKPRNVLLASVNFLLGCVGVVQVTRVLLYQRSLKDQPTSDLVADKAKEVKDDVAAAAKAVEEKAKKGAKAAGL